MPFWQFFRMGWYGCALLVWPSRIPHRIWKILFALGADEFLAMLEGKIREAKTVWAKHSVLVTFQFPAKNANGNLNATKMFSLIFSSPNLIYNFF